MIRVRLNDAIQVNVETNDPQVAAAEARRYFQQNFPEEFEGWRRSQMGLSNSTIDAAKRGVDEFQASLYSAAEGLGRLTNVPALENYGREGRIRNQAEAEASQSSALRSSFLGSQSGTDVARAGSEAIAGSLPSSGASMGGALAGAKAGRAIGGGRGALIGGLLGAAAASYPTLVGSNVQRQIEESGDITNPGAAFAAAVPQALAEGATDVATLGAGRFLRRPAVDAGEALLTRLGRGAVVGGATEAPTEVFQTGIERAQAGLNPFDRSAIPEYAEAGLGGLFAGAATGGVTRGLFGQRPNPAAAGQSVPETGYTVAPAAETAPADPAADPAVAPAATAPTRPAPIALPERPQAFTTPEEAEAFLASNTRFTPPVEMATPEAALGFINAARVSDYEQTVSRLRSEAIADFLPSTPAPEPAPTPSPPAAAADPNAAPAPTPAPAPAAEARPAPKPGSPVVGQEEAAKALSNLASVANNGDLNLNSFSPAAVAKAALAVRDIDPGRVSKAEVRQTKQVLDALVNAGYLSKASPNQYAVSFGPRSAPSPQPASAQAPASTPAAAPPAAPAQGTAQPQAPTAPVNPQDEQALWRGYTLNVGPQARSPFVAAARNIAAIRNKPFTRDEFRDFASRFGNAPDTAARDAVINDFVSGAATPATPAAPAASTRTSPWDGTPMPAPAPAPAPEPAPAAPAAPASAEAEIYGGPIITTVKEGRRRLEKQYEDSIKSPIFKYFASPIMTMGKVVPQFQPVADSLKRLYTRSQEATTEFGTLLESAAKLPTESRARIALALQESRSKQRPIDTSKFNAEENAAIKDLLKAGQRAYDFMIEAYVNKYFDPNNAKTDVDRARLQAFQRAKGDRSLLEMSADELRNASPKGYQEIQTYNRMRDKFYFPQVGLGTHFVAAYQKKPGGKEQIVRLYAYTPLNKAQRVRGFRDPEQMALARLREEFPNDSTHRIMSRGMQFENDSRAQAVRRDGDFIAQYLQELSRVSGAEGKQIIARMSKEIDKAQMNAIFRPNKDILRAVTPDNAAEYILDVMPKYFLSVAKIQARRYIQDDFAKAVEPLTPNDRAYWNELLDYATTPTEAYGTARALAFFMYLGAAPDTALVNLTQLPFVTLPRLTRDGGASAAQYFGSALKTVVFNRDFGKVLKGELVFTDEVIGKMLNKDEAAALIKARKQGIFTPLFTNESRGQVTADSLRRSGIADAGAAAGAKGINKLTDLFGRFMQAAEETNRLTTFLAAYRMAKANPNAVSLSNRVDNTNYTTPYDYAANVVFDTQFITSKEDRALLQRFRPEAEVVTQFMSFPLKMVEQYARHASMVIQGIKTQDPVLAKAGAVSLAMMIAPLVGFAGIWGLPFADSLREILERLIKFVWDDPVNFKVEVEKMLGGGRLASAVNNGIPHAFGYASLQKRLGIDPFPAQDLFSPSTLALFGPVGGLIEKPITAYDYYKNGDYWGVAATLLPRAMGNVVKGLQMGIDEEQFTQRGTRIVTPQVLRDIDDRNTVPASVRQALGFPPPELADLRERVGRQQELQTQMRAATDRAHMELARILLRIYEARESGDTDAVARYVQQYRERRNEIVRQQDGKPLEERIILNERAIRERATQDLRGRADPATLLRETRTPARPAMREEIERSQWRDRQ